MKSLKYLVLSLSLCAAVAHAQGNQPQADAASTQAASNNGTQSVAQSAGRAAPEKQTAKKDQCVGPVSFCNIYFGS
ncbi:MAG TPA: hypothetical protein VMJ11_17010 [Paraburkholderia sp.]|uniref:hypothetical protein n=1 Tax=Paraburkholderia sp. TaxID=1926495 RepID=UPI002BDE5C3E|nr:hypothetical protein [Paraburkholderia sp.]HTR08311.1 hypothetical protein [Paraburkholderia sp.]